MGKLIVAAAAWCALVAAGVPARGALVMAAIAAVLLLMRRPSGTTIVGHAHGGSSKTIARHEAGHAAAARGLGGRVRSVTANRNSGLTQVTLPSHDPKLAVAFLSAGRAAAGGWGCDSDDSAIRRELRSVPSKDRARVRREGQALGRRIVRQRAGQIRRDAATIERTGRL